MSSMLRSDGKIIDIVLTSCPFEFIEVIGNEAADDFSFCESNDDNDMPLSTLQVGVGGWLADARLGVVERVTEHDVQLAPQKNVFAVEPAKRKRPMTSPIHIHDFAIRSRPPLLAPECAID
jgi:hypothetical protein